MDFKVPYTQTDSRDAAYERVKTQITPESIEKFKVKADLNYQDEDKVITATGKGFGLTMKFQADHCEVALELSFMLKAFKGKILESLEKQLKRIV